MVRPWGILCCILAVYSNFWFRTEDVPYSGTLSTTIKMSGIEWHPKEIWVEIGTEFELGLLAPTAGIPLGDFQVDSGYGLSIQSVGGYTSITGTLSTAGDCKIGCYWTEYGGDGVVVDVIWEIVVHAVSEYPTLEFLSDPSDSIYATVTYIKT